jgi:hypothetical protein
VAMGLHVARGRNACECRPARPRFRIQKVATSCDDADAGGAERCRLTAMSLTAGGSRRLRLRRGKQIIGCRAMSARPVICLNGTSPAPSPLPFRCVGTLPASNLRPSATPANSRLSVPYPIVEIVPGPPRQQGRCRVPFGPIFRIKTAQSCHSDRDCSGQWPSAKPFFRLRAAVDGDLLWRSLIGPVWREPGDLVWPHCPCLGCERGICLTRRAGLTAPFPPVASHRRRTSC